MRLDKVRIPLIGHIMGSIKKRWGYMPRMHLVTARVGSGQTAVVAERWVYRGDDLHAAYDTRQVFRPDYPHAVHSVLPPWERQAEPGWMARLAMWWLSARAARPPLKAKLVWVERVQRLPEHRRIPALRTLGLI